MEQQGICMKLRPAVLISRNRCQQGCWRRCGEGMDYRLIVKYLVQLLSIAAIGTISYALFRVIILNKKISGGLLKEYWRLFYYLIGLLLIGYLTMPLFSMLPESSKEVIVGIILLAGAILVVKVINLFFKIIEVIGPQGG